MENQMKKLEQDAAGCDGAQSGRLSKYIERDLDNKVNATTLLEHALNRRMSCTSPSRVIVCIAHYGFLG